MHKLESIAERIRQNFDVRTAKRDEALKQARQLTRTCSLSIRAVHRDDKEALEANFVEANVTCALIQNKPLQTPEELGVENATYLNGLAEVVGELRRRTLDILRSGYSEEAERLLGHMDEIYSVLVTMDYPDAITSGLRRQTDLARGIIEKTRGDVTFSLRGEHLTRAIMHLSAQLDGSQLPNVDGVD